MKSTLIVALNVTLALADLETMAAPVNRVSCPDDGAAPAAQVDDRGVLHLVYVSGENVYYVTSSDNGKTFQRSIRVNSEPDNTFAGMFRGPDIALGAKGRVHVIWYNNGYQRKLPQEQWGVMYSYLDPGKEFIPARNLNHKPSDNYSLAANARGEVAIFWMAAALFLTASTDNGVTFDPAVKIEEVDTCECCASRAVFAADGSLYCAYRDKANNVRDMFLARRSASRTNFLTEKISVTPWPIKGCPMTGTSLTGAKDGLVMAWQTKEQIYYTRHTGKSASARSREIRVPVYGGKWPVALSAPDGTLLVTWKKSSTVGWQLFDANDKPLGPSESAPSKNTGRHAAVLAKDGSFLVID